MEKQLKEEQVQALELSMENLLVHLVAALVLKAVAQAALDA